MDIYLSNPGPINEHVGVDEEGIYIYIAPSFHDASVDKNYGIDEDYALGIVDSESVSDTNYDEDYEVDSIVQDNVPSHIPKVFDYEKK